VIDIVYLRQFRIGPYAIFDFVVSYLGIYIVTPVLSAVCSKIHLNISRSGWMWLTLPISVVFHLVFHQQTPFMKALINPDHYYSEALVILFMVYMGIKNVQTPTTES
jgi:hypothetical protein